MLIGTSEYTAASLPDIPAIETTINTLSSILTDLDLGQAPWDSQHRVTLINEGDLREIGHRLGTAADEATDLLLVYYTGRALIDKRNGSLYLGLPDSDPKRPGFNSLEYAKLRDTVLDSRAALKLIVLDARFPGAVDDIVDQLDVKNGYVLVSSFEEEASFAQPGEIHTGFSRHLNTILREGVPGGPGLLRIDDIYVHLLERMRRDGLPQPQARGTYVDGPLALIRNRGSLSVPKRLSTAGPTVGLIVAEQKPRTPEPADDAVRPDDTGEPENAGNHSETVPGDAQVRWYNEELLDWMADVADRLTEHAAGVAAVLLGRAVASVADDSERYAWFASRLAQALFRTGELEQAQDLVNLALDCTDDADVRVHLQSTLARCLDKGGSSSDAIAAVGQALGAPGLTVGHRARLLVLAARSHANLHEYEKAAEVASEALRAASDASDDSASDWALHIISMAKAMKAAKTDFAEGADRGRDAKNSLAGEDSKADIPRQSTSARRSSELTAGRITPGRE